MAHPNVQDQIGIPSPGSSATVTSVDTGLWVAAKPGVVFDVRDLARAQLAAGYVGVNRSANDRPRDANWYMTAHGLGPTLDALRSLLVASFGAAASVTPTLEIDQETGTPDLIFEIRTVPPRSYEEQQALLNQYLAQVPRPRGEPSPTLFWDPPQRAPV